MERNHVHGSKVNIILTALHLRRLNEVMRRHRVLSVLMDSELSSAYNIVKCDYSRFCINL